MTRAGEPRCKAVTLTRQRCKRRAQWQGLCFQHWREALKAEKVTL